MCAKCGDAIALLIGEGFSRPEALGFLWEHSAYPMGDNALERTRAFLASADRAQWITDDYASVDRALSDALATEASDADATPAGPHGA